MYDRSKRFRSVYYSTSENVGPNTYYLTDIFDRNTIEPAVPFNSSELRKTAFISKSLVENPSPNTYRIRYRNRRIVGGTSMQNKATRIKYVVKEPKSTSFSNRVTTFRPGKVIVGAPPRSDVYKVSTIPEKGCGGYDIIDGRLIKICNPPRNRQVGPADHYNPDVGMSGIKMFKWQRRELKRDQIHTLPEITPLIKTKKA